MEPGSSWYGPSRPLSDYVVGFWSYGHYAQSHAQERLLPTGTMTLAVRLDEEDGPAGVSISGAHSRCMLLDTSTPFSVIAVAFKPGGGFPFFGLPAGELQNSNVPLELLPGLEAVMLRERLLEAGTARAGFRMLERFLLAHLKEHTGRTPAVSFALDEFHRASRAPRVASVVERVGWTSRRFIARFRDEVGLTPKAYCRVARFQRVLAALDGGGDVDWADVALSCGYFDQAHFAHDFKEFSGVTPSAYLKERVSRNHVPVA